MNTTTNQASGVAEPDDGLWKIAFDAFGETFDKNESIRDAWQRVADRVAAALVTQPAAPAEVVADEELTWQVARNLVCVLAESHLSAKDCLKALDSLAAALRTPTQAPAARHLTITTDERGHCLAVTWQDDEHRILEVVWEAPAATEAPSTPTQAPSTGAVASKLTDAQLGAIAYSGFDSYWTEDCNGSTKEAWEESGKAVKQAVLATLTAPPVVQPASPAVEVASEPTDEQIRAAFTKHSGGPNPYYRCNECGTTEPGLREYLAAHWLKHNPSPPAAASSTEPASGFKPGAECDSPKICAANRACCGQYGTKAQCTPTPAVAVPGSLTEAQIAKEAYAQCLKASEIAPQGVQLYLFDVKRLGAFIDALAATSTAAQPGEAS